MEMEEAAERDKGGHRHGVLMREPHQCHQQLQAGSQMIVRAIE